MNNQNQDALNDVIHRNYSVDVGQFLSRGWEILQQNITGFIGFLLLNIVIYIVLAVIPVIGSIATWVISGPLAAGNFIVAFKIAQRKNADFGDFFKGFQNAYFLPIFLQTVVINIFMAICIGPAFVIGYGTMIIPVIMGGEPNLALLPVAGILGIIGLIVAIYLSVSYVFAVPLIIGKKLAFWPAMEASRRLIAKEWFAMFVFIVVLGLLNLVGALVLLIGLLITVPLSACAIAAAYESIVGLPTFDPSNA
jgi:membrane-anchored glycerophosphoryl diester phosphodiesterase (GDPDase)